MFRKHIVIVALAALFVAASSASVEKKQNTGMRRKVKEFTLCTNDQAEFYNDLYGPFFGPTESVKPLYPCEAGAEAQPIAVMASTCSNPGVDGYSYLYGSFFGSSFGYFVNGTGYRFNATDGAAPIVNCQETILFFEGSDGAKRVAKKKKPTKFGPIYNTITNNYAMVLDSPTSLKACLGAWSFINETDPSCPLTTAGCFAGKVEGLFYEYDPVNNPGVGFCYDSFDYWNVSSCAYECYEKNYDRANTNAFTSGYDIGNSKVVDIDYDGDAHPKEVYTISYKSTGWNPLFRP